MSNCPSLYHGEPGDPYGCYEEIREREAAEDRAFDSGVAFAKRKAEKMAEEWDREGYDLTFAEFVAALNL